MLKRLNPLAKLTAALLFGLASALFPHFGLGVVLVALLLIVAAANGLGNQVAKVLIGFGVPITFMLLLIQGCYSPLNKTVLVDLGIVQLGLEGTLYALKTVWTLLTFLAGLYLMNQTTSSSELVVALTEKGLPSKAGYLVLASLNVVPQMQRRMAVIREAQEARGLSMEGGPLARIKATVPLFGPVVMSSLTDAEERGAVLETHGFGLSRHKHTSYIQVHHAQEDVLIYLAGVLAVGIGVVGMLVW